MNRIESFMQVYMYELEQFLVSKKDDLKLVSFQSDEANTDRPLKEYLKSVIEKEFVKIPDSTSITNVVFDNLNVNVEELKDIEILRVLLPEEITDEIRKFISVSKDVIYTNPDICFEILLDGRKIYETIELKSTKQDSIPGSSVQQIVPNQWVIFIKHSEGKIEITTGQYIHAINSKMQFPDRSPRPQVSFKEMQSWNQLHRIFNYTKLMYKKDNKEGIKYDLITDWQEVLSKRWVDMLFHSTKVKANEPWFNNNMRKFILLFLEEYEKLDDRGKEAFISKTKKLIK